MVKSMFLIGLCALVSCGGHHSGGGTTFGSAPITVSPPLTASQVQFETGDSLAHLASVNRSGASGLGTFKVTAQELRINVQMKKLFPLLRHQQYLAELDHCPGTSEDKNRDGFIDIDEALPRGTVLIPLDSDLSSTSIGKGLFPRSNFFGSYDYAEASGTEAMRVEFETLGMHEATLKGKVLLVTGVSELRKLPVSVASTDGAPNTTTLPVACGNIL